VGNDGINLFDFLGMMTCKEAKKIEKSKRKIANDAVITLRIIQGYAVAVEIDLLAAEGAESIAARAERYTRLALTTCEATATSSSCCDKQRKAHDTAKEVYDLAVEFVNQLNIQLTNAIDAIGRQTPRTKKATDEWKEAMKQRKKICEEERR
jgi:hypothetical protein